MAKIEMHLKPTVYFLKVSYTQQLAIVSQQS